MDQRELSQLVLKIRAKFKMSVKKNNTDSSTAPTLVFAALASTRQNLSLFVDQVLEFCESSGYGRIEHEKSIMDLID